MILERALAAMLQQEIPELSIYKDELAWQLQPSLPYLLTSQVGKTRAAMGAGSHDLRGESGDLKVFRDEVSLRFTFRAQSDELLNGNDRVFALANTADQILQQLTKRSGITITDPETQTPIRIAYAEYVSERDIQVNSDRLPVIYQKALTYQFRVIETFGSVESVGSMEKIRQSL